MVGGERCVNSMAKCTTCGAPAKWKHGNGGPGCQNMANNLLCDKHKWFCDDAQPLEEPAPIVLLKDYYGEPMDKFSIRIRPVDYGMIELADHWGKQFGVNNMADDKHWGCKGVSQYGPDRMHAPECMNPPMCEATLEGNGGKVTRVATCSYTGQRYYCGTYQAWYCWPCHQKSKH